MNSGLHWAALLWSLFLQKYTFNVLIVVSTNKLLLKKLDILTIK